MFIYNNTNSNNNFQEGYKITKRKHSRSSIEGDVEESTPLNHKCSKRRRLNKVNIKFLKQLGFEVNKV